jgi:hypothetical protein
MGPAPGLPPARHCRVLVRLWLVAPFPAPLAGLVLPLGVRSRLPARWWVARAGGTSRAKPGGPRAPYGACSVVGGGAGPGAPPRTCACTVLSFVRAGGCTSPAGALPTRPLRPVPGCRGHCGWRQGPWGPQPTSLRWTAAGPRGQVGSAPAGTVHLPAQPNGRTAHAQFRGGAPGLAPPPRTDRAPQGRGVPQASPGRCPQRERPRRTVRRQSTPSGAGGAPKGARGPPGFAREVPPARATHHRRAVGNAPQGAGRTSQGAARTRGRGREPFLP